MNNRSPFLDPGLETFAIQCFIALKHLDSNRQLDRYLYSHIVEYSLYDSTIHTLKNMCFAGNLAVVKYLAQQGTDIHIHDDQPLRWAANCGHLNLVEYFVEQGADIHVDDEFVFRWAAADGYLDIVQYLVDHGADVHAADEDAIKLAAYAGHLNIVQYLVDHGADVHAKNECAIKWAACSGQLKVVKYLAEHGNYDQAQLDDILDDYPTVRQYLIKQKSILR